MKDKLTPIAYPTTPEESDRWGFDVMVPDGTPKCWVTDWKGAGAGFGISAERLADVLQFRIGEDLSELTQDDIFAGHTQMFKMHWHALFNAVTKVAGIETTKKVAHELGDGLGARGWAMLQEQFGSPVPLEKIVWYQDVAHLLYGPDTHAFSWCDDVKSVCTRTRCLFRPPQGMESCAVHCRTFDDAYIDAYMQEEDDLLCLRAPDLGEDGLGHRCIHMWTYEKDVVNKLPDTIKNLVADTTKAILRDKGIDI